ncbi:spermidine synthase with an N-terminal membrane domain protein [Kocuria marina]|uniref:Spermidine synthase with an N-terminal membrane domain protein n=1 Tax=Kocuria marina TaxID=223184 RepID=A0A0B0DAZ4_9MICC|nr:hypothetical protein [Kocuria marina]KHE73317.1 spermidine synthase with an N-terminal membrane domain protein [Kocuria marina]
MAPILAAAIVLAFIALGELVSLWSKARVPALLVAMLGVFVFAKAGIIPADLVETSTMVALGALIQPALMVHMGSLIPLSVIRQQWRAVLIALAGMVVGVGFVLAAVTPLFGFEYAVAGSGPLAGGIVSTALTTQGLTGAGVAGAVLVVPTLVLMLQSLPSMPLTNLLLRRYALHLRDAAAPRSQRRSDTTLTDTPTADATFTDRPAADATAEPPRDGGLGGGAARRTLVRLPESLRENQLFLLFLVLLAGSAAFYLGQWTGVSYSIWGLALGIALTALGVLPDKILERSNSFGLAMAAIICIVIAPLMGASIADVLASLAPVVAILLIGMLGILIGGAVMTKLLGWDPRLGMPVALTAMFGFPADYLIVQEVVRSTGRDEAEQEALRTRILPPMLIGGFTSVSAGSIVIASVLVSLL